MDIINTCCDDIIFNILYFSTKYLSNKWNFSSLYLRIKQMCNIMMVCKRWLKFEANILRIMINEFTIDNKSELIDEHARLLLDQDNKLLSKLKNFKINLRVTEDMFHIPAYYFGNFEYIKYVCDYFGWCPKDQIVKMTNKNYELYKKICESINIIPCGIYSYLISKEHTTKMIFMDSIPKNCDCDKCKINICV